MSRDFWNAELVKDMYEKLLSGKSSGIFVGTEIWRCISVELWMQLYIDRQQPAVPVAVPVPVKTAEPLDTIVHPEATADIFT